ncbi:hypothetical protein ACFFX0_08995 [Citricoccus parietis]|uniref:Uncharacterized protein n=1 Tax=Citricoccus parietis TaxID=592307 RepID=A0ABV5FXA6_9MICC
MRSSVTAVPSSAKTDPAAQMMACRLRSASARRGLAASVMAPF